MNWTTAKRTGAVLAMMVFGYGASAAAQLPPEIEMDRFLLQAEQAVDSGDNSVARAAMEKIVALQVEHGIEPAPEDHFRYAKVWQAAGKPQQARDAIARYLELLGRDAEHYGAALDLMNRAEAEAEAEAEFEAFRENPVGPGGIEFVWVPAGQFRMGSSSGEVSGDERPVTVRISRGFWLGKYEVTQSEWQAVMGSNPSHFGGCANCPVEQVSWEDAQEFIRGVNMQAGRNVFRLPTEAEWEYAARAGTTGDRYGHMDSIAWYSRNSGDRTHPVGGKMPNAFGLYDMLGNVSEWVHDWYGDYPGGSVTDPRGPDWGLDRVSRGGTWFFGAGSARVSRRLHDPPGSRFNGLGFRLLRTR